MADVPAMLLEVLGGGGSVRVATSAVDVPSAGGTVRFPSGLDEPEVPDDVEAVVVAVRLADADTVRRVAGPWVGREAVLRMWHPGQQLEDAAVLMRGVVSTASWDDPEAPGRLVLGLELAAADLSARVLAPHATASTIGWSSLPEDSYGEGIPVVIGTPGAGTLPIPSSPLVEVTPMYFDAILGFVTRYAVASHVVHATDVTVYDFTVAASLTGQSMPIEQSVDADGSPVATVLVPSTFAPDRGSNLFAAWPNGGGVLLEGELVRGLGSVLLWGALFRPGRVQYDLQAIRAARVDLDRFLVDAAINDPDITWEEWASQGILAACLVDRVEGPAGVYYRARQTAPDVTRLRAVLSTRGSSGGYQVTRTGPYADEELDTPGVVTRVWYGRHGTDSWALRVEYVPELTFAPGSFSRQIVHPTCIRARELLAPDAPADALPVREVWAQTSDVATAWAIARRHVELFTLPGVVAEFEGSVELGRVVRAGDTVEVRDGGTARLGLVRPGVVRTTRRTLLTVRLEG